MKSQQRYFKTVSHYLLYRTSKVGDDYDGGVDLQGPHSTITLSADTKTLTVIGLDSTHADGELRELRTMELSAAKASAKAPKAPTIHEWCDQLLECQVGARFWFLCFCELGFLPPYYSYPHSPDHFDGSILIQCVCVCCVVIMTLILILQLRLRASAEAAKETLRLAAVDGGLKVKDKTGASAEEIIKGGGDPAAIPVEGDEETPTSTV